MSRTIQVLKGLFALLLLVVLVAAVPWALWHYIGWPLPHRLPSFTQFTTALGRHGIANTTLLKALACVMWVAWAVFLLSIAVELDASVRGRAARRLGVARPFQPIAGQLLAAVVVAALSLAPRPGAGPRPLDAAVGFGRRMPPVAAMALAGDSAPALRPGTGPARAAADTEQLSTYVVKRNDTLWGIAERELGDPLRWSEIYALNEGRPEPGGATLDNPNWIYPGWTLLLLLPVPAASPASPPPTSGVHSPAPPGPGALPASGAPGGPPTSPAAPPSARAGNPVAGREPAPTRAGQGRPVTEPVGPPVGLPSGALVAGSFAAGVVSAVAAGRLRRRRGYRAHPPRPGVCFAGPPRPERLDDLLQRARVRPEEDRDLSDAHIGPAAPLSVVPDDQVIAEPDLIDVARRGDDVVRLSLGEWAGLELAGAGAEATLRAWLAALVTRDGPYAAEVLCTADIERRLIPGVELPSVRRFEGIEEILTAMEAAAVGRVRRLEDAEVTDAVSYRRRSPEDPFPLLLAIIDAVPPSAEARWSAVVADAGRLGFAALALGPTSRGEQGAGAPLAVVEEDGTVTHASPPSLAELLDGTSLFHLDAQSATDLLGPIAAVHNDSNADPADDPVPSEDELGWAIDANGAGAPTARVVATVARWPEPVRDESSAAPPITVKILGPAHVQAWGEPVKSGLRTSAYELLAWYALHPDGATAEAAIDALWPEESIQRGRERFWTALGNLRSRLHGPGKNKVEILHKAGEHYRPDRDVLDVDVWHFQSALAAAAGAGNPDHMIDALERAVTAYGGDLCPALDALWIEPVREDLHRRALDAHIHLAELFAHGRPERAAAVLEAAIELDPICEEAYRRVIALQTRLGHRDAAQRTWRLLRGRLAELDLEPEEVTVHLVRELLRQPPTTIQRVSTRR